MKRLARILAWIGFALSLAALGVALAWYANIMQPFWKGTAARYWSGVTGVPVAAGEDRYGQPPPVRPNRYFCDAGRPGGIWLHGEHYQEVPEAEVLAMFPEVIGRLIEDPTELRAEQVRALVGDKSVGKEEGLKQLAARRGEIGGSLERMQAFLRASYEARLARGVAEFGSDMLLWQIDEAARLSLWVERANRYWVNIFFEAVFLGGLSVLFWLPVLSARARRWMAALWGGLPVLLFVPYFLGYCRPVFFWSDAKFWGGALYPWVLAVCRPLMHLCTGWEWRLQQALPQVLGPLNQLPGAEASGREFVGPQGLGPLAPAVIGVGIALAVCGVQRFVRRSKRKPRAPTNVGG